MQGTATAPSDDRIVDLSKFNVEQTIAILRGAPETLKIARKDISDTWIDIETFEGSGHTRRSQHPHLHQQRVRKWLHRPGAGRRDQADQRTELTTAEQAFVPLM